MPRVIEVPKGLVDLIDLRDKYKTKGCTEVVKELSEIINKMKELK